MAEISLVSVRRTRLEHRAAQGDKKSAQVLKLVAKPGKFLSTVQIGMTLINIFTGVYSGAAITDRLVRWLNTVPTLLPYSHSIAITLVVILVTFFTLILGEIVPKQIGLLRAEKVARNVSYPLKYFAILAHPLIWLLTKPGEAIIRFLRIVPSLESRVTEDEIKAIIKEGTEVGEIQEIEQDIMERVFYLGDRRIGSLMTHRTEIIWLNVLEPVDRIRKKIVNNLYNSYPVCDGSLDKILGIVYTKDLLTDNLLGNRFDIRKNLKEPLFILESNTAFEVLEKFRETKKHFGLVVDEYGLIVGLVTLNDILMALVGEIPASESNDFEIKQLEDGSWMIDGQLPFYDFIKELDIQHFDKSKIKFNTLGGFALAHLRRIPHQGEKFSWLDYNFEIIHMDGNRIDKIKVTQNE